MEAAEKSPSASAARQAWAAHQALSIALWMPPPFSGSAWLAASPISMTRASEIDTDVLEEAIAAGRETLRLAPWLRGTRAQFDRYARAYTQIDNAVTSVEALSQPHSDPRSMA